MKLTRSLRVAFFSSLAFSALAIAQNDAANVRTGWFSDDRCAVPRVEHGSIGPTNRDCSRKCLREGARMVFIDEKAKAVFFVDNPDAARGQEGHYVQASGNLDPTAKTFRVESVKVLKEYVASCGVPKTELQEKKNK